MSNPNVNDSVLSSEPTYTEPRTESKEPPKPAGGWELQSMAEFLNSEDPEIAWLVDRIIPAGGLAILAARPKVGKSTLARCLAVSVAQGIPWLDRETTQGTVLFFALEESKAHVKPHFRELGASESDPLFVHCKPAPGQQAIHFLKEEIKVRRPALAVIDPLVHLIPQVSDLNDYAAVTRALKPFLVIARETGASVLLVHHSNKAMNTQGREILGSTALLGIVDVALLMDQDSRGRNLYSRPRYGEPLDLTELRLEGGWVRAGRPVAELKAMDLEAEILAFLAGQSEPAELSDIQQAVARNRNYVLRKLNGLAASGKVERTGSGTRGKAYRYSVPQAAADSVSSIHPIEAILDTESQTGEQAEFFPYHEPTFARPI